MILKLFLSPNCSSCPSAKKEVSKLESKVKVKYYDIKTPSGLAEATYFGVLSTPCLILVNDKGEKIKEWTKINIEDIEKCLF